MKTIHYVLVLFLIISNVSVRAGDLKKEITITKITPDLFCIVHAYPWPSNSLVAVMENGEILLVDTPYTPEATEFALGWIDKNLGKRKITAINTHFHVDRLGGNEALVRRNIPIYGSELTLIAIKDRGEASIKATASWANDESMKKYFRDFKYIPPTNIFDSKKGLVLNFGKEIVEVKFLGVGHSADNLFVFFPKKKLIFGGCAILSMEAKTPGNISDGNIAEWNKTIDLINTDNYNLVVPGHGKIGGIDLLTHTKAILKNNNER
jgi:metallo-beta-lactamase class B